MSKQGLPTPFDITSRDIMGITGLGPVGLSNCAHDEKDQLEVRGAK